MASQRDEPIFFLLKNRLPASESTNVLGRVVQSFHEPMFDYTPESPSLTLTDPPFARFLQDPLHSDNATLTTKTTSTSTARLELLSIASLSTSTTAAGSTTVTTPRLTVRSLKDVRAYFAALKAAGGPAVRRRLLDLCPVGVGDNHKAYLVVGTMSARAARFERAARGESTREGGVKLPTLEEAAAAAVAGGVPLLGGLTNGSSASAEAGFGVARGRETVAEFDVRDEGGGEQVFALACRVVRRMWRGLGPDVQVGRGQPENSGGQHFGGDGDVESDDEDGDGGEGLREEEELALVEELELGDVVGMDL